MMKEHNHDRDHDFLEEEASSTQPSRKRKAVYTILEREGNNRSYWLRLGTAYINRDDSLTVYLNALPVNNKLHIRELPEQNDSST